MDKTEEKYKKVGAVVIGRNEGQRLITCLDSLTKQLSSIVYVDSGSTDASISNAKAREVKTLSLDMSEPFTAARARNEGAYYLIKNFPEIEYIQFIDGDCELHADWINKALQFLVNNNEYSIVCGRLRERHPEASIYNQLMDIEWNTPTGESKACGGIFLIRVTAFQAINGFKKNLIASEEPEMCLRIRKRGWKIYRLDSEMALHDAAMTKFSQWWTRCIRTGYAFSLGYSLHGQSDERFYLKETRSILLWGLFLPVLIMILTSIDPVWIILSIIYPLQIIRLSIKRPDLKKNRLLWATGVVLGKIPEATGLLRFVYNRFKNSKMNIIEYK